MKAYDIFTLDAFTYVDNDMTSVSLSMSVYEIKNC